MRAWVLIAALAVVCLAAEERILTEREHMRQVLRSWKSENNRVIMNVVDEQPNRFQGEPDFISDHHISKRSVSMNSFAANFVNTRGCDKPGYTGESCAPLCPVRNPYVPNDDTLNTVSIDATNIANCSQPYVVYVDETMYEITFDLESETPLNPNFMLLASDGSIVTPDTDSVRGTSYTARFNFLFPGVYVVSPKADTQDSYCMLFMNARTALTVTGGFTTGWEAERSDFPTAKFVYFDTPSVVTLRATNLTYPGQLQSIGFTGTESHVSRYLPLSVRYNCTYPYILERYTCQKIPTNDGGHNLLQVEGITDSGNKFRRTIAYTCILAPVTTTVPVSPTPSPAPLTTCHNGGQLLNDTDGSPYCYCFGLFAGVDCSQIVCANGGYLATPTSQRCECPDGFSGLHCNNIVCTDISGLSFDAEHPTLTLVIRSRTQLSNVIQQAVNAVGDAVDLLGFDPNYLTSFIVVLFDNNKLLSSKRYTSWDAAVVDLNKAISVAPSDGGCDDITFSAIAAALGHEPNNKSPVYVITDANPNDSNEKETVFQLESYWRAPIYFLYVTPAPGDGCNTSPDSAAYRDMVDIAIRTSGNTFYITDRTQVQSFLYQHLYTTLFRSQLLLSGDYSHCGLQNTFKSVAADQDTDMFVVVATGSNISLLVTDPFTNRLSLESVYSDGINNIWVKRGVVSGQWFFNILSQHPNEGCTFKVYQKKFNSPGSTQYSPDYDIFWAFATTITSTGRLRQPVLGFDASPVFHVTNYPEFRSMSRVHANLQIYAIREGQQVEVYGASGMFRDACELQFYFPEFTCRVPDETLYFNFFARDRFDMTLQRAGTMYCATFHPTPAPEHGCQNGGVMNPSNNTCFCTPQFTGVYCQNVVCYNGGTPATGYCVCPPGYAGESCELARCTETGPNPEFIRYGVDMIFAVEITKQSVATVAMLNVNFQEIIRDVTLQQRGWIRNFVLVGFNSTWGGPLATAPVSDPSAVITALNTIASTVPADDGCTVKLWDALNHAIFAGDVVPGSYIEIFQTSPEDDTDARSLGLFYEMSRSMDLIIYGFLASSPRNTPEGFACNATVEQYYTLLGIVAGSTGDTYLLQPAEVSNAIQIIPLQFSNGLVNFNAGPDCRFDDGLVTFFPIDAYTQTIQFKTFGFGSVLTVFNGAGVQQTVTQLFYDDYSGEGVFELRKPCDDGWEPYGQNCIKFFAGRDEILPMPQARNFCASAGGFLADDLNDGKNAFLFTASARTQFWIGLYNNAGTYVWDRGTSPAQPLNQPQTFWGDNQPSTDPTDQCVYFNGISGDNNKVWTSDTCSTPRPFICQKHQYDANNKPTTIGDDDLPAGWWYAKVKTAPAAGYPNNCSIAVRVQSSLQILSGYTTNIGSDNPQPDPIQDSSNNRLVTYIHSADNENRSPILTDAILWDAYNGTFYNGLKYSPRFDCQYGWVSQNFPCPNGLNDNNEFGVMHIGEDEFGNTFQRITFGHCSKAEITCGNGGIRQGGVCICNDYWTGSQCTVPICVNGGTRNSDQRTCTCPSGYEGLNCEFPICQPIVPALFSNDRKSLVFIVETTKTNQAVVDILVQSLKMIVSGATTANPIWFSNFGLVTFDTTGTTFEKYDYTSMDSLVADLTSQSAKITDQGSCALPFLSVLARVAADDTQIAMPNSEIFMFTTSTPSDLDKYVQAMDSLFNTQAHLHYIYTKAAACPAFADLTRVDDLVWLGYGSGGNMLFTDATNVAGIFSAYLPTLYGASVLQDPTGPTGFTCGGDNWFVPVDKNTTNIYVTTTSEFGTLSVKDPTGTTHSATVLFSNNEQKVYALPVNNLGGIWTLQLSSPGFCLAHVYSVGGAKVYTKFALTNIVSSTPDPTGSHQDGRSVQPVGGFENVAVFHLAGESYHKGRLQYTEIFNADNASNIIRSELYPRLGCSYEYYSDPFTCNSDMIAVFVHGVDEANQKFRRQEIVICNGRVPTTGTPGTGPTQPPVTQATQQPQTQATQASQATQAPQTSATQGPVTQNTGTPSNPITTSTPRGLPSLQFDVVFLIDGSQTAQPVFDSFTKFIQTLMVSFNVGQAGARVGLVVIAPDMDDQAPPAAQFNTIGSQSGLNSNLATLYTFTDFEHAGQLLTYNLQVVSSADYMNAGYRTNITNHLLVYITSSTSFFTDPTPSAQTIRSQKTYGIITVGYGQTVDQAKLQTISGGAACSFTANDVASLNNNLKPIQNLIWNADTNGGLYC